MREDALKQLHKAAIAAEKDFTPVDDLDAFIERERRESYKYGGKTVFGDSKLPRGDDQLKLDL